MRQLPPDAVLGRISQRLGRLGVGELDLAVEEVAQGKVAVQLGEDGRIAGIRGERLAFLEVRPCGREVAGVQVGLGERLQRDTGVVAVVDLATVPQYVGRDPARVPVTT